MFGTIFVTFGMTALSGLSAFLYYRLRQERTANAMLRKENASLNERAELMTRKDGDRQRRIAYERGFSDARETDKLYRETLEKYQLDQRSMVMMYGEKHSDMKGRK